MKSQQILAPTHNWPGRAVVTYYPDGTKESEIPFMEGRAHGRARTWYPAGTIRTVAEYVRGVAMKTSAFRPNGKLRSRERRSLCGAVVSIETFDDQGQLEKVLVGPWRVQDARVQALCAATAWRGGMSGRSSLAYSRVRSALQEGLSWLSRASSSLV